MSGPARGPGVVRAEEILRAVCGPRLRTAFELASLTTFRIGGAAALYLEPDSDADLAAAARAVAETRIPFTVIGKGSNLLVSDGGFPGLAIRLGHGYRWAARDGDRITAGGAMPLPALAGVALSNSLAGLEFGVAIPASLGGAVRMNAGAHDHSMSDVLEEVDVFRLWSGARVGLPADEVAFRYRGTDLPQDGVVVSAVLRLGRGDPQEIRRRMGEARDWRRRTQPLAEPNCGSVFKNPAGDHAARLVEASGGKGLSVGGASVSAKHANFIVAGEGTRAADVAALIRKVQEIVAAQHDVHLEPEVHLVGDFDLAPI